MDSSDGSVKRQVKLLEHVFQKEAYAENLLSTFQQNSPGLLEQLKQEDQPAVLDITLKIARRNPTNAYLFFEKAPDVLRSLGNEHKATVLDICRSVARTGDSPSPFFESCPKALERLPEKHKTKVLQDAGVICLKSPSAAHTFLTNAEVMVVDPDQYQLYYRTGLQLAGSRRGSYFLHKSPEFAKRFPQHYSAYTRIAGCVEDDEASRVFLCHAKDVLCLISEPDAPWVLEQVEGLARTGWNRLYEFFSSWQMFFSQGEPQYQAPLFKFFLKTKTRTEKDRGSGGDTDIGVFKRAPDILKTVREAHGQKYSDLVLKTMDRLLEHRPWNVYDFLVEAPALLNAAEDSFKRTLLDKYADFLQKTHRSYCHDLPQVLPDIDRTHHRSVIRAVEKLLETDDDGKEAHSFMRAVPRILSEAGTDKPIDADYLLIHHITDPKRANEISPKVDRRRWRKEYGKIVSKFY